jgi:hypothetical protein
MLHKQRSESVSIDDSASQQRTPNAHDLMVGLDEPPVLDRVLLAVRKERERAFGSRVEPCYELGVAFAIKSEMRASSSEEVVRILAHLIKVEVSEAVMSASFPLADAPPYSAAEPG